MISFLFDRRGVAKYTQRLRGVSHLWKKLMLFLSIQQELDCITDTGEILGKIKFDDQLGKHIFYSTLDDSSTSRIRSVDESAIAERLRGLDSGQYQIPMQDDD